MAWFKKKQTTAREVVEETSSVQARDDGELVAALAAAVAAYLGTSPGNIAVRSYRKASPAWRRSAREMQIFRF